MLTWLTLTLHFAKHSHFQSTARSSNSNIETGGVTRDENSGVQIQEITNRCIWTQIAGQ